MFQSGKNDRQIAAQVLKIGLSRLFDARLYRLQNPDIGHFPALLHWVKFGENEGRRLGLSPFAEWLIPHIQDGALRARDVGRLRKAIGDAERLQSVARDMGLNAHDYKYLDAIYRRDFDEAYRVLPSTSDNLHFDGAYYFAVFRMQLDMLQQAYASKGHVTVNIDRLRKATDVALALGRDPKQDFDALIENLSGSTDPVADQIFRARLPVIASDQPDISDIVASLEAHGLKAVGAAEGGRGGDFVQSVGIFDRFITAATHNAVSPSRVCITGETPERARIVKGLDHKGAKIRMRILMPGYWVHPQSEARVTKDVLVLHKSLIRKYLAKGQAIVPDFATPIFDITQERHYGLDTVSYHTITRETGDRSYTHYKEAYLPDYFTHDPRGYSGWSSLADMPQSKFKASETLSAEFHAELYQKYITQGLSKYIQKDGLDGIPDKPFIFAALQVPEDTVATWAYMRREVWLEAVCAFAKTNNLQVVIKQHPKDKSAATTHMLETFYARSHVVRSEANIHDLIDRSQAVVTVNSGVGFEALLHHKPVITCGTSDYAAVTYVAKETKALETALDNVVNGRPPASVKAINQFLYQYLNRHCWEQT